MTRAILPALPKLAFSGDIAGVRRNPEEHVAASKHWDRRREKRWILAASTHQSTGEAKKSKEPKLGNPALFPGPRDHPGLPRARKGCSKGARPPRKSRGGVCLYGRGDGDLTDSARDGRPKKKKKKFAGSGGGKRKEKDRKRACGAVSRNRTKEGCQVQTAAKAKQARNFLLSWRAL